MTNAKLERVDIEWIGGPLDGRITTELAKDLKMGQVAWHDDLQTGQRTLYYLEWDIGKKLGDVARRVYRVRRRPR